MPTFFTFTQGPDTAARYNPDTEPLLGRFRAVPPRDPEPPFRRPQIGLLAAQHHPGNRRQNRGFDFRRPRQREGLGGGSAHAGYGAIVVPDISASDSSDEEDDLTSDDSGDSELDDNAGDRRTRARRIVKSVSHRIYRALSRAHGKVVNLYVQPRQGTVKRTVNHWYTRYLLTVILPASVAIAWCAIPIPQYDIPWDDDDEEEAAGNGVSMITWLKATRPGHGKARVEVNFWFFLVVFYGLYNLVGLMWITKIFNIYNLNWWPKRMGFPMTISSVAIIGTAAPILVYYRPELEWAIEHNTVWISWTFVIMAMPVMIAFIILTRNERHLGLRKSMSQRERITTPSWWTIDPDDTPRREQSSQGSSRRWSRGSTADRRGSGRRNAREAVALRRSWLPASFVRFNWFCLALTVGLCAYVLGETYVEIYLRTLPHNSWETIGYVYSWVITVHLLDILTGWVLGVREGERVGSYPLSWIFKLYYMITYQTYVRALYARLRSPAQFLWLQILSSGFLVVLVPLTMHPRFYHILTRLGLTTQSYAGYQKLCLRNVFIRFIAENASMAAFIGSVAVLHFGNNKDLYPYFAFDNPSEPYTFRLTYISSLVTWACELVAAGLVRLVIRWAYGVDVDLEGKMDLIVWPELVPTSAAVTVHVLQNMLFSIIRLQFKR